MSKSIQMKDKLNEKMYPHPYYPIGSIYLSVNSTNPSKWFDGTWELIAQGRTLVGVDTSDTDFNEVKKTGGEKKHTLTVDEIPKHNHTGEEDKTHSEGAVYAKSTQGSNTSCWGSESGTYKYLKNINTGFTGGNQSHNNLQPYFTCYIWCRTA